MDEATIALTIMTLAILAVFFGFLVWGIGSGQFRNIEQAKYQVFRRQKPGYDSTREPGDVREEEDDSNASGS